MPGGYQPRGQPLQIDGFERFCSAGLFIQDN
jgi:hypothetical protein